VIGENMKSSTKMQRLLDMLKAWKGRTIEVDHSSAWKMAHALAEAHYLPAIDFFVSGLNDPDWVWRQDCVQFLGFHYHLEKKIVEKIRESLITDPSEEVRMSAASVLGRRSNLPDQALFHALESDPSHFVREAAFESVLELIGIPYKAINREIKRLKAGDIQPTLEYVKQIARSENIELPGDVLLRSD
jgi:HEAT repeat protein